MAQPTIIALTQNRFAIVDADDFDRLSQYSWHLNGGYAFRDILGSKPKKSILMHREVLSVSKDMEIDHINGNKLDNRKSNLRATTHAQNQWNRGKQKNNTSGFKGVFWKDDHKKWLARIGVNKKMISLGYYSDSQEASRAYDDAAVRYHGRYARLNSR
jgi:hypothetical protein